jgi:hypothetical protein
VSVGFSVICLGGDSDFVVQSTDSLETGRYEVKACRNVRFLDARTVGLL